MLWIDREGLFERCRRHFKISVDGAGDTKVVMEIRIIGMPQGASPKDLSGPGHVTEGAQEGTQADEPLSRSRVEFDRTGEGHHSFLGATDPNQNPTVQEVNLGRLWLHLERLFNRCHCRLRLTQKEMKPCGPEMGRRIADQTPMLPPLCVITSPFNQFGLLQAAKAPPTKVQRFRTEPSCLGEDRIAPDLMKTNQSTVGP